MSAQPEKERLASFADTEFRKLAVEEYERVKLMRLFDLVDYHANTKKSNPALCEFNTGDEISYATLRQSSTAFAAKLLECGLKKGDIVATSLPFMKEHIYLLFACMRLGVVIAPLDLRLKEHEIAKCFDAIRPKMYFFLGQTPVADFRPMVSNLMKNYKKTETGTGTITHWVQFQKEKDLVIDGAIGILDFVANVKSLFIFDYLKSWVGGGVAYHESQVSPNDPAIIIFTTGSTGNPKVMLYLRIDFFNREFIIMKMIEIDLKIFENSTIWILVIIMLTV